MNLYELHERMTGHLFPAYSNTDERVPRAGAVRRSWCAA